MWQVTLQVTVLQHIYIFKKDIKENKGCKSEIGTVCYNKAGVTQLVDGKQPGAACEWVWVSCSILPWHVSKEGVESEHVSNTH